MKESSTVVSVFIVPCFIDLNFSSRIGNSYIWVGDDPTPWSTSLTLATADPIYAGGFINLDRPVKGRYVVLRREGAAADNFFTLCEIKVYGLTNLLEYGASILKTPDPTDSAKSADNLINNLRTRSARHEIAPIIDSAGN